MLETHSGPIGDGLAQLREQREQMKQLLAQLKGSTGPRLMESDRTKAQEGLGKLTRSRQQAEITHKRALAANAREFDELRLK